MAKKTGRPRSGDPRDGLNAFDSTAKVSHGKHLREDGRRCPRCGTPFAWTDLAALARCAELARAQESAPWLPAAVSGAA